jgi:hypothetical protein
MKSRELTYVADWSRLLRLFLVALALIGVVCTGAPVQAQGNSIPVWDVTATLTITGNNVCGGGPCTETLNYSFDYTYTYNATFDEYDGEIVGNPSVSSYGALGSSFSGLVYPFLRNSQCGPNVNYMDSFDSEGDEIDLYACGPGSSTPRIPSFGGDLFGCATQTCINDFAPSDYGCKTAPCIGIFLVGSIQENVVQVPEGGTILGYCVISLASMGWAGWDRRSRTRSELNA